MPTNNFNIKITKVSRLFFTISIFIVAFHYWNFITITKLFPQLIDILYVIIIISSFFSYPSDLSKNNPEVIQARVCPKCNEILNFSIDFECKKCGELEFKKRDK